MSNENLALLAIAAYREFSEKNDTDKIQNSLIKKAEMSADQQTNCTLFQTTPNSSCSR